MVEKWWGRDVNGEKGFLYGCQENTSSPLLGEISLLSIIRQKKEKKKNLFYATLQLLIHLRQVGVLNPSFFHPEVHSSIEMIHWMSMSETYNLLAMKQSFKSLIADFEAQWVTHLELALIEIGT